MFFLERARSLPRKFAVVYSMYFLLSFHAKCFAPIGSSFLSVSALRHRLFEAERALASRESVKRTTLSSTRVCLSNDCGTTHQTDKNREPRRSALEMTNSPGDSPNSFSRPPPNSSTYSYSYPCSCSYSYSRKQRLRPAAACNSVVKQLTDAIVYLGRWR